MNSQNYHAAMVYYVRRQAYFEALSVTREAYKTTQIDEYRFWEGYCHHKLNNSIDSEDIFNELEGKTNSLSFLVNRVKSGLREQIQPPNDNTLNNLLLIEVFENNLKKAEKLVSNQNNSANYNNFINKALVELLKDRTGKGISKVEEWLGKADKLKPKNPLNYLLQIEMNINKKDFTKASHVLEDLENNGFDRTLILLEKSNLAIIKQQWNYLSTVLSTLSLEEPDNILGLRHSLTYCLVVSGDSARTNDVFMHFLNVIDKNYYNNSLAYTIDIIELVHCLGAENQSVLKNCIKTLEELWSNNKDNYEIWNQLAYAYLLIEKPLKALEYYKEASKLQNTKQEPLVRMVMCNLMNNDLDDAENALDFLKEVFSSLQLENHEIYFLNSILNFKRSKTAEGKAKDKYLKDSNNFFDKALKLHLNTTKQMVNDFSFFKKFNPSFLLLVTRFFMIDTELSYLAIKLNLQQLRENSFIYNKCTKILEIILGKIPGLLAGYTLLTKASLLHKDLDMAKNYVNKVLERDNLHQESYYYELFIALLKINNKKNIKNAFKTLQSALSANFELLNNPAFMFLKSQAEMHMEQYEEAKKTLEKAKALSEKQNTELRLNIEISIGLAILHTKMVNYTASNEIITELIINHGASEYSDLIIIANSEIKLLQNDVKNAIGILQNVDPNSLTFTAARTKLADIYLNQLKIPRSYVQCYYEIYKKSENESNRLNYANALRTVQNYEEALVIYKEIEKESDSEQLSLYIGECLTESYNFVNALQFYEDKHSKYPKSLPLLIQLCGLHEKLGSTDKIFNLIKFEELKKMENEDPENVIKTVLILYRLYNKKGMSSKDMECLEFCIDLQRKQIETAKNENTDVDYQRQKLSELHISCLGSYQKDNFDADGILSHLEEALKNDPENLEIQMMNAQFYYSLKNFDLAKEKARKVLRADLQHKKAIQLLADCLLAKQQPDNGIKGFSKILEKQVLINSNYYSLSQLIWFYRNSGKLNEFKQKMDKLKKQTQLANSPVFNFTLGLYNYFIRNFNTALEYLYISSQNDSFRKIAILIMIDIYIHPNSYPLYSNFFYKEKLNLPSKKIHSGLTKLVNLLAENNYEIEHSLYSVILDFITNPLNVDNCIVAFESYLKNPRFSVYQSLLLYYLGIFYLKSKSKEKLKNTLISIRNLGYHPFCCFDEYYFKAQLLCADTLLNKDKLKPAKSLIDQCLNVNKNYLSAYEYLYLLNTKSKEEHLSVLQTAFDLTNKDDPNIGYKYAKQLMDEENYVESFKICKIVLEKYSNFKKIETDILSKVKKHLLETY